MYEHMFNCKDDRYLRSCFALALKLGTELADGTSGCSIRRLDKMFPSWEYNLWTISSPDWTRCQIGRNTSTRTNVLSGIFIEVETDRIRVHGHARGTSKSPCIAACMYPVYSNFKSNPSVSTVATVPAGRTNSILLPHPTPSVHSYMYFHMQIYTENGDKR